MDYGEELQTAGVITPLQSMTAYNGNMSATAANWPSNMAARDCRILHPDLHHQHLCDGSAVSVDNCNSYG